MAARLGEFPCYKLVNARLDDQDFKAFSLAATKANMSCCAFVRHVIKQYLVENSEPSEH